MPTNNHKNFASLSKRLKEISNGMDDAIAAEVTVYTIKLINKIITLSPVDEGVYRANHRVSIGYNSEYYDENLTDKDTSLNLAKQVMSTYSDIDLPIYISSNMPYAKRLEYGHSDQAKAGVYSVALREVSSGGQFGKIMQLKLRL